ncbi:MAG: hypothetical protein C0598_08060 [Marinilabiliales bacterium]|nr:MAG: hypothetical protein C0598_08060 [Marinilabiliales bacterium]
MKKQDYIFIAIVLVIFLPFFIWEGMMDFYINFNKQHGIITSFIKFAILATGGELIGLRIKTGKYYKKGFGIFPRMIVWGFLGISIKIAFIIFASGTPIFLNYMGFNNSAEILHANFSMEKLFISFCISLFLNIIFAPIMMTFHKITDIHIINNGGTLKGFFTPIKFREIFVNLNWDIQWNFVFKKTIPLFWIPAHTITFLLPADFQVLFAALLGIALGVILAIADFV